MAPDIETVAKIAESLEKDTSDSTRLMLDDNFKETFMKFEDGSLYPEYLPYYANTDKWPQLELFDHIDPASRADRSKSNLLKNAKTQDLTPYIGTVVEGVQISQLSNEGLDELALFTAERKLLLFRDQDFKDIGPKRQVEIGRHYGPLHTHPTAAHVKGHTELAVVYRDAKHNPSKDLYNANNRLTKLLWHSDVSYERQPPSTTFFWSLDQPDVGGDTLYVSMVEAYNRLSPEFQKVLQGLRAVHSGVQQAERTRNQGAPVRREPPETEHPVVRVHPVTGEKSLYINQGFTRRIVGFKDEESDTLLNFLYNHIAKGADFQVRATYKPGTVVIWDNRIVLHSGIPDFDSSIRRHAVRLTPQGEAPIPATAA
ncbi:hypothetical protein M422DRAFT_58010 [Sphaerobolus stellatus SS14]|nr:hypothetical protein M422DRAFT_58010 [Sphaerobolus stellatus SS14]